MRPADPPRFGCFSAWHDRWTAAKCCPVCGSSYKTPARLKIAEAKRRRLGIGGRRG